MFLVVRLRFLEGVPGCSGVPGFSKCGSIQVGLKHVIFLRVVV